MAEFTKVFNLRGEKTEKVVMAPIFHEITEAVEKLEAMKVSEDGDLDAQEAAEIKKHIGKIQECCNKLIDLGLYDDSQSKTIRDRAAAAIRSIVLDIHNNLDDMPKAEQLLKVAMQFVGTSGMENKLKQDLDQRILSGFGGVSEYGITVRWDKTFLAVMYLTLLRRQNFQCYGGVRFGGTLTLDDAWQLGFRHVALPTGSGNPVASDRRTAAKLDHSIEPTGGWVTSPVTVPQ